MKKIFAVICAGALCFCVGCSKKASTNTDELQGTTVNTQTVKKGEIKNTINFEGNLVADSEVIVTIATPGRVLSTNVGVGSKVKKGQLLFSMDSKDVSSQKTVTQAQHDAAKASTDYINEMISSNKKQLDNLKQTKSQLEQQINSLPSTLPMLLPNDSVGAQSIINHINAKDYQGAINVLEEKIKQNPQIAQLISVKQLLSSYLDVQKGIGSLESAITTLEGQKVQAQSQYDVAKASLKALEAQISNYKVYAPISGVVGSFNIKVGEYPINQIPLTIVNMDKLKLNINMTDTQIGKFKVGSEVTLTVDALDNKQFTGKISSISPTPNMQTGMYPVTVEVNNSNHEIKPGFFAKAEFTISKNDNALYVPVTAIYTDDIGEKYVFVAKDNKAVKTKVTTGIQDKNDNVEILSGLNENDVVVTSNINSIQDGTLLNVIKESATESTTTSSEGNN